MKQFKHKKTGKIAEWNKENDRFKVDNDLIPNWLIENSADWEEVVEEEYEILSVIDANNEVWRKEKGGNIYFKGSLWVLLESFGQNWRIHSVKRLSDGEIFTIGDLVKFPFGNYPAKINKIIVVKDERNDVVCKISEGSLNKIAFCVDRNVGNLLLENAEKSKQPLFVTEDGKEIYEGDKFWYPNTHVWGVNIIEANANNYHYVVDVNKYKTFSTKDKAEESILENKPCLSIADVFKVLKTVRVGEDCFKIKLEQFAKSKIQ